ncbi:MAG: hypothetical protein M1573_02675 [Candidatus Parvarchaeota archaeon]|nr:hypothetical protein [Candidatus Parvarchaeota archaeon]MCL5018119.1 hypothetical protein [Candidatus Parvarchaeota archaeon]
MDTRNVKVPTYTKPTATSQNSAPTGKEFVFRTPDGKEVGRAKDIAEFKAKVNSVPLASLEFHSSGRHFSPWFRMIGRNDLASEFDKLNAKGEALRSWVLKILS